MGKWWILKGIYKEMLVSMYNTTLFTTFKNRYTVLFYLIYTRIYPYIML